MFAPRCSAHSISAVAQKAVSAVSQWHYGEVQSKKSMRKVQQVVASAWLCCQLWQGRGTVLQDAGLQPASAWVAPPPPQGLLRKWHMIWKLSKIFCVYETAPKSLKKELAVFTHKLDGL